MTELNKEALENLRLLAERATERVEHVVIEPDIFTELINKYPMTTITTLEELEELPVGTVIYAANCIGAVERFKEGWFGCGNTAAWSSAVLARYGLPARVLYKGGK